MASRLSLCHLSSKDELSVTILEQKDVERVHWVPLQLSHPAQKTWKYCVARTLEYPKTQLWEEGDSLEEEISEAQITVL